MAYTAAAMYGCAAVDEAITGVLPGDRGLAAAPVLLAVAVVAALLLAGPRLPRWALATVGPIGVVLIAQALAGTPGAGDAAVLYMWPVLWMTFFFGRRGAISIVACIGVAHAIVLLSLPAASSYVGRWVDVMISVCVVATVVVTLVDRNDRLLARLAEEARVDALTGLLNRRGFDERASLELARAKREGDSLAIVMFDIDYFKRVNDEWGHEIGDRVLAWTGELLAASSRDIDVVARFGGEEFVVLLPGSDSVDAASFAERVRTELAAANSHGLPGIRVSAGIHSAAVPERLDALLRRSDAALYSAKRAGRDQTVIFETHDMADGCLPLSLASAAPAIRASARVPQARLDPGTGGS